MTLSKQKIGEILVINTVISLPWGFAYTNISFILVLLFVLFFPKSIGDLIFRSQYLPLFLFFIVHVISFGTYFEGDFLVKAYDLVYPLLPLVIFPLFLNNINLSKLVFNRLLITFSISTLCIGIFVLIKYMLLEREMTLRNVTLLYTNIHIPYYALYLITSLLAMYFIKIRNKYLYSYFLFSLIILLFLGSKMGVLNLIGVLVLYILKEQKKIIKYVVPLLIISLPLIFLYTPFGHRFNQEIIKQSDQSRLRNWKSGMKTISDSFWLGYGFGNEKEALQKHRPKNSYEYKEGYNSHNQFIDIAITFGMLGLILYIFMMLYYVYIGYQRNNFFLIIFILVFNISSLTENLLDRQKGIILFSVFVPLLLIWERNDNKDYIRQTKTK
ncbi:O-antigen ligase [Flammeovirga sp. EKP202]|uniref:O-antigen ligase family protein n=1 Tax=Flammeovirga sp. EKP202 TaxID=2770592 RepID=UPI001660024E|nr:O-antigen ligase family protein [Flammeovirga sp. EKP202]MBD0399849.1 O-antigen ligase family protein [Flammeovirga sp. EKP202]